MATRGHHTTAADQMEVDGHAEAGAGRQNEEDLQLGTNMGYVLNKLMRASLNENIPQKRKWETFIQSYYEGKVAVGGRLPVSGAPAWVTLEVANGGFATGSFMAGGPLLPHESEYYKYFFSETPKNEEECRAKLNAEFLTARGLSYLTHLLETSQFEIKTPEEGALLTIAWMCNNNHEKRAKAILDIIEPWFGKLRFYPFPSLVPLTLSAEVSVATVAKVVETLAQTHTPDFMLRNRNAVDEVLPAYDALVAAVLHTTRGQRAPEVVGDKIEGDLPFEVLDEIRKAEIEKAVLILEAIPKEQKSQRFRTGHAGILLKIAKKVVEGKNTPRDSEVARKVLAHVNKKRGLPGTKQLEEYREKQKKDVSSIGVVDAYCKLLIERLAPEAQKPGLANPSTILHPVQFNEAKPPILPAGKPIPESLVGKVKRAKLATLDELCSEGLIPSAEVLAVMCPSVVAKVLAQGLTDRTMAALYGAIYQAFKNRRSLLLLNLEKQVQINEIPWYVELENLKPTIAKDKMEGEGTKRVLEDILLLAIKYWPETIFPNKFIQILYDLSLNHYKEGDKKGIAFAKELASDIFMGTFSGTFLVNAQIAAKMMRGTLYEKYYELDYEKIGNFKTTNDLDKYCGATGSWGYNVAENGKVIEKCMIVTTHNLALVFDRLNLREKLQDVMPELPRKVFNFIISETHNLMSMDWQTRLQHLKNAAYAFRQMVFFLSLISKEDQSAFFEWVFARCDKIKDEEYKGKLLRPVKSLHADYKGTPEKEKTIFRGWVAGGEKHFLMPNPPQLQNLATDTAKTE